MATEGAAMVLPYAVLKRLSRKRGLQISECLALSTSNDPFYVGCPAQYRQARWARWVYGLAGSPVPVHVRRLHYVAASRPEVHRTDGQTYTNSSRDWDLMHHACKYARYLGLIPFEAFEDRRSARPILYAELPASNLSPAKRLAESLLSGLAERLAAELAAKHQSYHVEVWLEKSSVQDEILPAAREHMVNVVTSLGEMSITAVVELVRRIVRLGKPVRIFYVSDFDPAGRNMPVSVARKLEYLLRQHRGSNPSIKLCPIMLTPQQCVRYSLLRTPIKPSDRKARFERCHGPGATELDALAALYPGTIGQILQDVLSYYCSKTLAKQIRSEVRNLMPDLAEKLRERMTRWVPVVGACDREGPAAKADSARGWLYDSGWGYLRQLATYRRYQNSRVGLSPPVCKAETGDDGQLYEMDIIDELVGRA